MKKIVWSPKDNCKTQLDSFIHIINKNHDLTINNYFDLYDWSITETRIFWKEALLFTDIFFSGDENNVIEELIMKPGNKWFPNVYLNFAENLLKNRSDDIAIISKSENSDLIKISYDELYQKVAKLANSLKKLGLEPGDRVAAVLPNSYEAIIAMLATTSIGAIWSSCSPDFGLKSITDRFNQINPKIIFSNRSYQYNGNTFNFDEKLNDIVSNLQSLENVILVEKEYKKSLSNNYFNFSDLLDNDCAHIIFEKFPFDHPVFILYTSGTTGLPKSIVHGAGGTLLQHKKELLFHCNVSPKDIVFYYTTCGWMMWNWLASFLSTGSTIVLYDGSPFFPNKKSMWNLIDELNITIFGTSAKFIDACKNSNTSPKNFSKLSSLKQILSTGSPLVPESFDYVYDHIKEDVLLGSISGGTDIISCFVLNNPTLPVYRGEIQCRGLGMDVDSFDETGKAVRNQKGELVCKTPFPSMPVSFWDDDNGEKFNNAYFNKYQNTWAHGDFIEINDHGGVIIYGRSDATLNPGGVRIGTAEIYRIVETFKEVEDSLVVGQEWENDQRIILFLKISSRGNFSKLLLNTIKQTIKTSCSPRHVPSIILPVKDIPYTISGKKVELAVKNIIQGNEVFNKDALANPESLDLFRAIPELS